MRLDFQHAIFFIAKAAVYTCSCFAANDCRNIKLSEVPKKSMPQFVGYCPTNTILAPDAVVLDQKEIVSATNVPGFAIDMATLSRMRKTL